MGDVSVPTVRTDLRTQWAMLFVLVLDLIVFSRSLPWPWLIAEVCLLAVLITVVVRLVGRASRSRPPVEVTPQGLRLPDADSRAVEIAWPDIAAVTYPRRLLLPHLVITPADPGRVHPAPDRWQRAAATTRDGYHLDVALGGTRASRARLREAIASHLAAGQ